MFDWLFEGRLTVYLVLIGVASIAVAVWARSGFVLVREVPNRTRGSSTSKRKPAWPLLILGVVAVFALAYFLMDRLVETRREQISRKLQEMARAVKEKNVDRIFSHISESFHFRGRDKAAFRTFVENTIDSGGVNELEVWDVRFPESGEVTFQAKPRGGLLPPAAYGLVRAEFVRDPDGQWRLEGFEIFNPYTDSKTPLPIQNLP